MPRTLLSGWTDPYLMACVTSRKTVVSFWEMKNNIYLEKSQGSTLYFQNLLLGRNEVGSRLHFSHKSCQNTPRW